MGTTKVRAEAAEEKEEKKEFKKAKEKKERPKAAEAGEELRAIVRVVGSDLNGEKPLWRAIRGIKGIGPTLAKSIPLAAGIDMNRKLGSLNDQELQHLEQVIKNPANFGIPVWVMNRRRDPETGKDVHLTGSDLEVRKKFDVQHYIDLKSYRGVRHMYGLPVRGQHTRSTFRKGRVVGVIRKSELPTGGAAAGAAKEQKEAAATTAQAAKTTTATKKEEPKKEEKK